MCLSFGMVERLFRNSVRLPLRQLSLSILSFYYSPILNQYCTYCIRIRSDTIIMHTMSEENYPILRNPICRRIILYQSRNIFSISTPLALVSCFYLISNALYRIRVRFCCFYNFCTGLYNCCSIFLRA